MPSSVAHPTLLLRRTDGPQAAFCMTRAAETRDAQKVSKLVFHHYGHRYFLYQVWQAGDHRGHEVGKSRLEQELAKNGVKSQSASIMIEKPAVAGGKSRTDRSNRKLD